MKPLRISKLMDEYTDTEFSPEGGAAADIRAVKERVLTQARAERKRRPPSLKTVLLVAVLAMGCFLSIAAGLPVTAYQLFTGGTMLADVEMSGPNRHIYSDLSGAFPEDPLVLENGRLWLILNGKRMDITDRIDEKTPYVIERKDSVTGLKTSLILGGVPEDFGWCLWQELPNGGGYSAHEHNNRSTQVVIDGVTYEYSRELEARFDEWDSCDIIFKPWYERGERQLTIFR